MKVLISHPHGAVFANQAAVGLERHGMLAAYFTGVGYAPASRTGRLWSALAARRPVLRNRRVEGLAPARLKPNAAVELGARATARLLARARLPLVREYDAIFVAHDLATAARPWPAADAVYAYEDGALATFSRARRKGLRTVWDLPIPHHGFIADLWEREQARWPGALGEVVLREPPWKSRRKERELATADVVSVASRFTAESLPSSVRGPVLVTPYGFPVEDFAPKRTAPSGPFTFLVVGSHDLRKGTPYLLEAWRRAALRDARLVLVGRMRLERSFLSAYAGSFEHVPHVARSQLGAVYRSADVLLFPTLGDGFGMVIQEAMCAATPVVTTRCGGGPECIEAGRDGWLVPERDVDALVDVLRMLAKDRDLCFSVGQRARARAERWTASDAGDALAKKLAALGR